MMDVRYCPGCGTPTVKREDGGRPRDTCPACGWVHYSEMAIGVGALIIRDEQVLLVERSIPPVGRWTLPSGWIEQDENLAMAVVREVKEETDLDCTPVGIVCIRNMPRPGRNETYVCFLCEVSPEAQPRADGVESAQARFVSPADFNALDVSVFTRFLVEEYLRDRPGPLPASRSFNRFDLYPDAAIFAAF